MRRLLIVVLGLLSVGLSSATGAVLFVSPNGSGTQSGADAANPRSWASVVNNWTLGDRVQLAAGTYNVGINVTLGGTLGNRVTIVGDLANPSNVVFTGSFSKSNRNDVTLKGVTINGNLSCVIALRDSFSDIVVLGSAGFTGFQYGDVRRFRFGTPLSGTRFVVAAEATEDVCKRLTGTISQFSTFEDGTVYAGVMNSQESNAWGTANSHNIAFRRLLMYFHMASGVDQSHPVIWYRMKDCVLEDCALTLKSQTTMSGSGNYIFSMRDSSQFNRIERNTFVVDTTGAGLGKFEFAISGTGFPSDSPCPEAQRWSGSGSCKHNTYRDNSIDIDGGFAMFNVTHGDSVVGNSIYSDQGLQYLWGDSLTFAHNTVYVRNASLMVDTDAGQPSPSIDMHHNIFYTAGGAGVHNWTPLSRIPTPREYNRNLYYSRIATDSSNATDGGVIGPGTARCVGSAMDCNSRWLDPGFTKPSRPNVNLRPVSGSFPLSTNLWGGDYVGAFGAAPAGDVTAPGAATDVTLTGSTSQTIDVQFTSPGDDGSTGTPNRYDVRYSTAGTIDTPAEWDAAAVFASPPTPVAGGGVVTFTITGLTPATTFFVAIRAVDEANNIGGFGNSPSRATSPLADVTPPSAIASLAVIGAPTSSAVFLQWTAPGDDNSIGFATSYQGRYSTSPITTEQEWSAASQVSNMPTPQVAGTTQSKLVSGLIPSTRYYFNVRAVDEASNIGGLSNNATAVTADPPDVTLPATVVDLGVATLGTTSLLLGWTAAGDDGYSGNASSYEVRRSASQIVDESAWASATSIAVAAAGPPGYDIFLPDAGLSPSTTYWYAVRYVDEAGNMGGIDSDFGTTSAAGDVTAPNAVSTLTATATGTGTIRLDWVATGNDAGVGTAANYRIKRRAGATFVLADSAAATVVPNPPIPAVAGTPQTLTVSGLTPGTQYAFAMWVQDAALNTSGISNAATATTTSAPTQPVATKTVNRRMGIVLR